MSQPSPELDREAITAAFRRLGDRLAYRGVVADVYVFGGGAMALAYDLRRSTRGVDALLEPHGVVLAEAAHVATELGLPTWWLNEQVALLAEKLGLYDVDAVLAVCAEVFPEEPIPDRARLLIEDMLTSR